MRAGDAPLALAVVAGTKYSWCSCGLSKKQPLCDGSHKGTPFRPLRVEAEAAATLWLCTCKATRAAGGKCDGSHLAKRFAAAAAQQAPAPTAA